MPKIQALRTLAALTLRRPRTVLRGLRITLALDPWHLSRAFYDLFYLAEALLVGDWMTQRGLGHLHVHFSGAVATVGMLTAETFQLPFSLTVHGPDEFFDQSSFHLRRKFESASLLVCISDFCRSQVMRVTDPRHWSKMKVIRLGIRREHFGPMRSSPGQDAAAPVRILTTGRLVPAKGQLVLLQALLALRTRGLRPQVTLIGDGSDREHLEEFVQQNSLDAQVHFAGAQSHAEARAMLGEADLFVLPSFAEGVPVALMEAMAAGVPCLSTFVAGIPELIRHEQDGLLVPAGSSDALANAIERLAADPALRQRLTASAYERVMERYNLQSNLVTLASVFRDFSSRAGNARGES